MTRYRRETDETRRRSRRRTLEALEAVDEPTTSQQRLRARLQAQEDADPSVQRERQLRQLIGLDPAPSRPTRPTRRNP